MNNLKKSFQSFVKHRKIQLILLLIYFIVGWATIVGIELYQNFEFTQMIEELHTVYP